MDIVSYYSYLYLKEDPWLLKKRKQYKSIRMNRRSKYLVRSILTVLLLLLSNRLLAQVTGRVITENGQPIEAVYVMLRSIADSTLTQVTVSDSTGYYALSKPEYPFSISYSCIGFNPLVLNYDPTLQSYHEVTLKDNAETLSEATVIARTMRAIPTLGGIVCTINNKTILKDRSVADLLSYAPLVAVSGLESFRVADKKQVVFYINGRRSHMTPIALFNYLRSLSAEQVSSLKILHQPPLEYGVDDDCAVIDIIVRDNNVGFQGTLRGEVIKTHNWKETSNTTLLFQTPKFHSQLYFSVRNLKDYERAEGTTHYFTSPLQIEKFKQCDTRRKQYDFNLTSEYQLSPDHLLGASVDMYDYEGKPKTSMQTYYRTNSIDSVFKGNIDRDYSDRYLATALFYRGKLTNGISLSAEFTGLWSNYYQNLMNNYSRSDIPTTPTYLNYMARLPMKTQNYETKFRTGIPIKEHSNLTLGAQANYRQADYKEEYHITYVPTNYYFANQQLKYNEKDILLYALLSYSFPCSITCTGGFYGQYNKTSGAFNSAPYTGYNDRWYLLPYLDLNWQSRKGLFVAYNFSTSNYYHSFTAYSPFKQWSSITTYSQGNPTLSPIKSQHHALTIRYKNLYAKLFYSQSRDATLVIPTIEPHNIIARRTYNHGKSFYSGLSLGYGMNLAPWWYLNGNANFNNARLKATLPIVKQYTSLYDNAWIISGNLSNAFTISERYDWTADFNISYSAPYRWAYATQPGMLQCNLNMRKAVGKSFIITLWCYKSWIHSIDHGLHTWGVLETRTPDFCISDKSWGEDTGIALSLTFYLGKSSLNQHVNRHSIDASRIISE